MTGTYNGEAGTGYSPGRGRSRPLTARVVTGSVLLAVGLGVGGYGAVSAHDNFANPLSAPYQSGAFTQHLLTGRYLVYAEDAASVKVTAAKLTVTDPSGQPVAVTPFAGHETQTRSGNGYTADVQFHSSRAGLYHFVLASSGPPRIIIARTLVDSAKALIRPAIEVVAGAILAIIGLVVLGKALSLRRWQRASRAPWWQAPGGGFTPAGAPGRYGPVGSWGAPGSGFPATPPPGFPPPPGSGAPVAPPGPASYPGAAGYPGPATPPRYPGPAEYSGASWSEPAAPFPTPPAEAGSGWTPAGGEPTGPTPEEHPTPG